MALNLNCPTCGQKIAVPDSAAGKTGKCPNCQGELLIPDAPAAPDAAPPSREASARPPAAEGPSEPGGERETKMCPYCAEEVLATAKKCKHCGEYLSAALRRKRQKENQSLEVRREDQELSTGDWIVAILCSGIGCIAGIVWMLQGKPKGQKMVLVSIGMIVAWTFIKAILGQL